MSPLAPRLGSLAALAEHTAADCASDFDRAGDLLSSAVHSGGTIFVCGNGGSAAQALHFAAELTGRYRAEPPRRGLPAVALTADVAALTCIGNDFGFESVFARQVDALAKPGDALVCLTTSGRSTNVRLAGRAAEERGAGVVWVTGQGADPRGPIPSTTPEAWVRIPSKDTALVQEVTLSVLHSLCERIEEGNAWE